MDGGRFFRQSGRACICRVLSRRRLAIRTSLAPCVGLRRASTFLLTARPRLVSDILQPLMRRSGPGTGRLSPASDLFHRDAVAEHLDLGVDVAGGVEEALLVAGGGMAGAEPARVAELGVEERGETLGR